MQPEVRIVFYISLGSMVIGGALMAWQGMAPHTLHGVLLLVAIGVLAVVAQLLMTRADTVGHTLVNTVLQHLGILFAYGYGLLLFGETLNLIAGLGMILIAAAGLLTSRARSCGTAPAAHRGRHPPGPRGDAP